MSKQNITQREIDVTEKDLPLTCPMPDMNLWNAHPKVSLQFNGSVDARCPYCGTVYHFKGELPHAHH